jgi:hypothetical protein
MKMMTTKKSKNEEDGDDDDDDEGEDGDEEGRKWHCGSFLQTLNCFAQTLHAV